MQHKLDAFARLLTIMDELREQCPWDRKQTFQTLRNLTIEEYQAEKVRLAQPVSLAETVP